MTGAGLSEKLARPGGISYFFIPTVDPRGSADFYGEVFGWTIRGRDTDRPSFEDRTGHVGGAWHLDQEVSRTPGLLPWIYMDDVDAAVERITANGGEIVEAARPEGPLRVARFRDPSGNVLGVWQDAAT